MTSLTPRLDTAVVHRICRKAANRRPLMAIRTLVAHQAAQCCRNMISGFSDNTKIGPGMASLAGHRPRVGKAGGRPIRLDVAGIAGRRRRYVVAWLVIHPRIADDVTCRAGRRNAGVAVWRNQGQPGNPGAVTHPAGLGCLSRNMQGGFAGRLGPVMTVGTFLGTHLGRGMRETGRRPGRGQVTCVARICRRDVA